ncbi:ABC transporter substrate-binding protein, partial [Moorena sp. SIO3B2]
PQARYQSAKDILNDLKPLLDSKSKIPTNDNNQFKRSIVIFRKKIFSNPIYTGLIFVSLIIFIYLSTAGIKTLRIIVKPETCPINIDDNISCGEESLLFGFQPKNKADGIKAYRDRNYLEASNFFKVSWEIEDRDPETLIYWNNAKLKTNTNIKPYTIAVGIPIRVDEDTAKEILRGIAQAQHKINNSEAKINGRPLRILIADDHNDVAHAKDMANQIASQSEIIAVVGHSDSGITLKALEEVYQKHRLVIVAPISSSESLTDFCIKQKQCFFFRIISNHNHAAKYLVDLLLDELVKKGLEKTAGVVYSHPDNYSNSFKSVIEKRVREKGKFINLEPNDLSNPSFDAGQIIEYAQQNKVNGIFVVPDGGTTREALPNAIDLIKSNQGRLLIGGSSSLYHPQTLEGLSKESESVLSKFIAYSDWHRLEGCVDTPEGEAFCQQASKLWKTTQVSLRTATAYDAIMTIAKALETLPNPNRIKLQEALRNKNFSYSGVTGTVKFKPDGNRTEPPGAAVKVIQSTCDSAYKGLEFVPIEYVDERQC